MARGVQAILLAVVAIMATIVISRAATTSSVDSGGSAKGSPKLIGVKSDAGLPASYVNRLGKSGTLVEGYALRPALARRVTVGTAERGWVVPGRAGACLVVLASHGGPLDYGCDSLARIKAGGIVMVRRLRTGPVANGLVSEDASVTVTTGDGKRMSVPVRGGVFSFDGAVQSVSVRGANGRVTTTDVE
jgi:hypothetical protein